MNTSSLVQQRVSVRAVSPDGWLGCTGYMALSWDAGFPGIVRLAETAPDGGAVEFSRGLLLDALDGEPVTEGPVSARLRCLRGAENALLVLRVPADDGEPTDLAIRGAAAREFAARTTSIVPAGEEWRHVPDTIAELEAA